MNWGKVLTGLWAASLSSAVIILAIVLLRAFFQSRTPRHIFCLLWDVALVRLLILVSLPSPVSIWQLVNTASAARVSQPVPPGYAAPVTETTIAGSATVPGSTALAALPIGKNAVMAAVWLAIGLMLAAWFLWGHLRFRRVCADSLPCNSDFALRYLAACSLHRTIQVRTSDRIAAPLTYGVLHPVILLPAGMGEEALPFVLEHEYAHIRRFDTLRKTFLAAVLCLHWFNPLVWVLYVLSNRDMELACDEAVTAQGADRAGYAQLLLCMEERRSRRGLSGSHFSQNALEERIRSIMKHKKTSIAAIIAVLVVISITTAIFASPAPEDASSRGSKPQTGYVHGLSQAVENDVMVLSHGGEDGEKQYSVDGGKTWLSEEAYHAEYGSWGDNWQVEWWTAEDYEAWLEEEKQALQSIIGERGYTGGEGWFTWDQKQVDETIALYESILKDIQNGALYSKTITDKDGNPVEDVCLGSGTLKSAEISTFKENAALRDLLAQTEAEIATLSKGLDRYEPFGLNYEIWWTQNEPQLRMSWNGIPVHSLYDTETGTWFANNLNGTELGAHAVDLETVYQAGELQGLRKCPAA